MTGTCAGRKVRRNRRICAGYRATLTVDCGLTAARCCAHFALRRQMFADLLGHEQDLTPRAAHAHTHRHTHLCDVVKEALHIVSCVRRQKNECETLMCSQENKMNSDLINLSVLQQA